MHAAHSIDTESVDDDNEESTNLDTTHEWQVVKRQKTSHNHNKNTTSTQITLTNRFKPLLNITKNDNSKANNSPHKHPCLCSYMWLLTTKRWLTIYQTIPGETYYFKTLSDWIVKVNAFFIEMHRKLIRLKWPNKLVHHTNQLK